MTSGLIRCENLDGIDLHSIQCITARLNLGGDANKSVHCENHKNTVFESFNKDKRMLCCLCYFSPFCRSRLTRAGVEIKSPYCSSQPSMVHWLSSSIFPCRRRRRPAMVTSVQISLLVAPHPKTHTFSESL